MCIRDSFVTILRQRADLAFPIDAAFTQRTPCGAMALDAAILGVHVRDALHRQAAIAIRICLLYTSRCV